MPKLQQFHAHPRWPASKVRYLPREERRIWKHFIRGVAHVTTSKKVASKAAKILRSKSSSKAMKSVAASDLEQRKKTKPKKR
jgi:hypothetical protein